MTAMPEFDMRRVKRRGDIFTTKGVNDFTRDLCGFCGSLPTCKISASLRRLNKMHPCEAEIQTCTAFLPIIPFRPPLLGLSGFFNTFRKGGAWVKRVEPGRIVAMGDLGTGQIIGEAEVLRVVKGPLADLMPEHATYNHMCLREDAPEASLQKVLDRSYGKNWAAPDAEFTVIYLERCDDGEDHQAPGPEGRPAQARAS